MRPVGGRGCIGVCIPIHLVPIDFLLEGDNPVHKESSSSSVVVPVNYCAVHVPYEFCNHTTYSHVWKGSVLAAACLLVCS